jgi:hypothetical protein
MGWSWEQYEDCPSDVLTVLLEQIQADHEKRESERQAQELRRKYGR